MPNPLYTYILNIYDLILVGFYGISTIVGYLMPNPLYIYIYIYRIWLFRLFNAKSSLYIYIRYIRFRELIFYLLRTFCPHLGSVLCCFFFHYVSAKFHIWPSSGDFLPRPQIGMMSLVTVFPVITAFQLKTIIYDLVWLGFMAYQPL